MARTIVTRALKNPSCGGRTVRVCTATGEKSWYDFSGVGVHFSASTSESVVISTIFSVDVESLLDFEVMEVVEVAAECVERLRHAIVVVFASRRETQSFFLSSTTSVNIGVVFGVVGCGIVGMVGTFQYLGTFERQHCRGFGSAVRMNRAIVEKHTAVVEIGIRVTVVAGVRVGNVVITC